MHEDTLAFAMSYYIVRLYVNTLYFTLYSLKVAITIAETCGFCYIFFNVCCVNGLSVVCIDLKHNGDESPQVNLHVRPLLLVLHPANTTVQRRHL